jgi:hypothetical protein
VTLKLLVIKGDLSCIACFRGGDALLVANRIWQDTGFLASNSHENTGIPHNIGLCCLNWLICFLMSTVLIARV